MSHEEAFVEGFWESQLLPSETVPIKDPFIFMQCEDRQEQVALGAAGSHLVGTEEAALG